MSFMPDGALIVHNARTGAVGSIPPGLTDEVRQALLPKTATSGPLQGVFADLAEGGFLVPEGTDEALLAHNHYVSRYSLSSLHLIVMPTEQCNFRCVYCYETFARGEMPAQLQQAVIKFAKQEGLRQLVLSWFGGEPLLAKEIVRSVTRSLSEHCRTHGIDFVSSATTNGWFLTPDLADELIPMGLNRFQITLDGVGATHDAKRPGHDGSSTFAKIMENLRYLKRSPHEVQVTLRHNFTPADLISAEEFITAMASEFSGDSRFVMHFHPVGKWGGPNDNDIVVCESQSAIAGWDGLRKLSLAAGMGTDMALDSLQPNGNVCYAANPRSFVIGSDGRVYKCTVELDRMDRNVVGNLNLDGTMSLDWRKMALWCEVNGMDGAKKCTSCYFSPTCHGAICPKEWLDGGEATCPPVKQTIRDSLPLIPVEALLTRSRQPQQTGCAH